MRPLLVIALIASCHHPEAAATSAPAWTARAPGLDTAELAVTAGGAQVETVALVRIDPRRYELTVHDDPTAPRSIVDWQAALGAEVVINGGYFEPDFQTTAPLRAAGTAAGPRAYVSDHGALVIADDGSPAILDLRGQPVDAALAPYRDALVSFPLLVDGHGATRARGHADWYANRQFVGIDDAGRLIIGTTRGAYFSLPALAAWLVSSHLTRVALNLDGGPSASQIVATGTFRLVVTPALARAGGIRLPIVLAARARSAPPATR